MTSPPTAQDIAETRTAAYDLLAAAQSSYDAALKAHEEYRTHVWLPTPRRRRAPLTATKNELAAQVTQTRTQRDDLLTSPLVLNTLTAHQRESATHLTREGRRYIERARNIPPQHPGYQPTAPTTAPTTAPEDPTS